ncbi:hypothetical protein BB559_002786 [Furculomyces boomerangus]|uniref:Uncharacterized protein n=1 Tax=Furculomyces boomerangus TaxID=61424 RepID=A0A2T9YSI8_9FUNG|nr:hypothetical protein BB559_002786 [Furculomyces boomerangus]
MTTVILKNSSLFPRLHKNTNPRCSKSYLSFTHTNPSSIRTNFHSISTKSLYTEKYLNQNIHSLKIASLEKQFTDSSYTQKNIFNSYNINVLILRKDYTTRAEQKSINPFQKAHINRNHLQRWSEQDTNALKQLLERRATDKKINYDYIANKLGRTKTSCKWKTCLINREKEFVIGRWSQKEDESLIMAVDVYGPTQWKYVSDSVKTRNEAQCRQRWVYINQMKLLTDYNNPKTINDEEYHKFYVKPFKVEPHSSDNQPELSDTLGKITENPKIVSNSTLNDFSGLDFSLNLGDLEQLVDDSGLDGNAWTKEQDKDMLNLFEKLGRKWKEIAANIKHPPRTASSVFNRYTTLTDYMARHLNSSNKKWTIESDLLITYGSIKYGLNWKKISSIVPQYSALDCRRRWHILNSFKEFSYLLTIVNENQNTSLKDTKPVESVEDGAKIQYVSGIWSKDEDKKLVDVILSMMANSLPFTWKDVSRAIVTRSAQQCRYRWINYLFGPVSLKKWTLEEDMLIVKWIIVNGVYKNEISILKKLSEKGITESDIYVNSFLKPMANYKQWSWMFRYMQYKRSSLYIKIRSILLSKFIKSLESLGVVFDLEWSPELGRYLDNIPPNPSKSTGVWEADSNPTAWFDTHTDSVLNHLKFSERDEELFRISYKTWFSMRAKYNFKRLERKMNKWKTLNTIN